MAMPPACAKVVAQAAPEMPQPSRKMNSSLRKTLPMATTSVTSSGRRV